LKSAFSLSDRPLDFSCIEKMRASIERKGEKMTKLNRRPLSKNTSYSFIPRKITDGKLTRDIAMTWVIHQRAELMQVNANLFHFCSKYKRCVRHVHRVKVVQTLREIEPPEVRDRCGLPPTQFNCPYDDLVVVLGLLSTELDLLDAGLEDLQLVLGADVVEGLRAKLLLDLFVVVLFVLVILLEDLFLRFENPLSVVSRALEIRH